MSDRSAYKQAGSGLVTRATTPPPGKERRHAAFFDAIGASLEINTPDQFCAWMRGDVQHIFPHGMMACGIGEIEHLDSCVQHIITCNFPQEYIQALQQQGGMIRSPIIEQWIKTRRPVLFEMLEQHGNSAWLENFKRYGLQNMAAHGLCDLQSRTTSYFAFAQIPGKLTTRHAGLLEMLVPHLHVALTRALHGVKKESSASRIMLQVLTEREQQVLQWLGAGKTNWEVAQILHISENTVKRHVQHILLKLKVKNRAQAVSESIVQK